MALGSNVVRFKGAGDLQSSLSMAPEYRHTVNACRQLLVRTFSALNESFFVGLDDALFKLADKAESNTAQDCYFDAMRELRRQRNAIESHFNSRLLTEFDRFWREGPASKRSDSPINVFDSEKASLVPEADLEEELAVDNMVAKGEKLFFRDIYALNERFGFIVNGAKVENEANPVGPAVVADTFKAVVLELRLDLHIKLLIFKRFEIDVIEQLGQLYEELNGVLARDDILPTLSHRVVRDPTPTVPKGGQGGGEASNELFSALQELLGLRRGHTAGTIHSARDGGVALITPDEVCEALSALQRQGLGLGKAGKRLDLKGALARQLRTRQGEIRQSEADTIDVISMLFELILEDKSLPDAMGLLLGRLQIPMLKVAIQDKSFFSRKDHPARKLLNSLARAAVIWERISGEAEDKLYTRIGEVVQRVVDDFDRDIGLFVELHEEFEAFIEAEVHSVEVAARRAAEAARGKERRARARLRVDQEIVNCLGQVEQLPPEVFDLINGAWRDVLVLTLLRKGEESDEWRQAVLLVRRLIWSVQPKIARVETQSLLKAIPDLLKGLRMGLKAISFDQHKMTHLFKDLQGYHLLCLKGERVTGQLTREEFVPLLAAKRKEVKAAGTESVAKEDPCMEQAKALTVGCWLKVTDNKGRSVRAKLSWRSEVTGNCLFVNNKGVKLVELSLDGLAQWFREGRAEVVEERIAPLMDRAMDALFASLKDGSV